MKRVVAMVAIVPLVMIASVRPVSAVQTDEDMIAFLGTYTTNSALLSGGSASFSISATETGGCQIVSDDSDVELGGCNLSITGSFNQTTCNAGIGSGIATISFSGINPDPTITTSVTVAMLGSLVAISSPASPTGGVTGTVELVPAGGLPCMAGGSLFTAAGSLDVGLSVSP